MIRFTGTFAILTFFLLLSLGSCSDASSYEEAPYAPKPGGSGVAEGSWEVVLREDPAYPDNVYLTKLVEFHPGKAGGERNASSPDYYNTEGYPLSNLGALGPPEGSYPSTSSSPGVSMTVLGSGGWGVWQFDPDYRIIDGPGADFITFANHNVFGGDPDDSWNELGRIYVSADGVGWYENGAARYTPHPSPGNPLPGVYDWDVVRGLHGNTHAWANFRREVQAEERDPLTGLYSALTAPNGLAVEISRYFKPDDPYLGGDRFDLADFVHTGEENPAKRGQPWPAKGKMGYLKLVDDPAILDGQDWAPQWMTGARLMAAMGINVEAHGTGAE